MAVTRERAWETLTRYTKSESLLRHALAVEASTRWYAMQFGEDQEFIDSGRLAGESIQSFLAPILGQVAGEILRENVVLYSWIICIRRRILRSSSPLVLVRSLPSKRTSPCVGR